MHETKDTLQVPCCSHFVLTGIYFVLVFSQTMCTTRFWYVSCCGNDHFRAVKPGCHEEPVDGETFLTCTVIYIDLMCCKPCSGLPREGSLALDTDLTVKCITLQVEVTLSYTELKSVCVLWKAFLSANSGRLVFISNEEGMWTDSMGE